MSPFKQDNQGPNVVNNKEMSTTKEEMDDVIEEIRIIEEKLPSEENEKEDPATTTMKLPTLPKMNKVFRIFKDEPRIDIPVKKEPRLHNEIKELLELPVIRKEEVVLSTSTNDQQGRVFYGLEELEKGMNKYFE